MGRLFFSVDFYEMSMIRMIEVKVMVLLMLGIIFLSVEFGRTFEGRRLWRGKFQYFFHGSCRFCFFFS